MGRLVSMWDLMQSLGPIYAALAELEAIGNAMDRREAAEQVEIDRWADDGGRA